MALKRGRVTTSGHEESKLRNRLQTEPFCFLQHAMRRERAKAGPVGVSFKRPNHLIRGEGIKDFSDFRRGLKRGSALRYCHPEVFKQMMQLQED